MAGTASLTAATLLADQTLNVDPVRAPALALFRSLKRTWQQPSAMASLAPPTQVRVWLALPSLRCILGRRGAPRVGCLCLLVVRFLVLLLPLSPVPLCSVYCCLLLLSDAAGAWIGGFATSAGSTRAGWLLRYAGACVARPYQA
jgi:hypothetical protein